uniref:Uncharacterized protein n=1 Tax=Lutzomyia longipalpis TaxID=7200 RepID=A0A1B0GIJ4_LUTLO
KKFLVQFYRVFPVKKCLCRVPHAFFRSPRPVASQLHFTMQMSLIIMRIPGMLDLWTRMRRMLALDWWELQHCWQKMLSKLLLLTTKSSSRSPRTNRMVERSLEIINFFRFIDVIGRMNINIFK